MSAINRDEWLSALAEAEGPTDPSAISTGEFCAMTGLAPRTAGDRLARLVANGLAVKTYKFIVTPSGARRRVSAYKLVQKKKR